ncbi:MAG: hypothetical protein EZS28_006156 [Streblomastix strix]|uniref:Uncharacterized protein n=1 Tax=Streblomastix strix TaxID=222440 RepID=A0A5J4WTL4_9EUKA|nr:MAG: hypothetical protein EZS28_006156 [Streblomastix strix]
MIPPEKPDIVYLLAEPTAQAVLAYKKFNVRIVNIGFGSSGAMQSIMSFSNIKSLLMTFVMSQQPTWFYLILLNDFVLIIYQLHVIPALYEALTQTVNGLMFDCFVDQDVVSAPSDLYHSFTFENFNCTDRTGGFYGKDSVNVFHTSTLFEGTKESKTLHPNKYMLAWKLATDDSFMCGNNSSKLGARTNIQVILHSNFTKGILVNTDTNKDQNQNDLKQFIALGSYPDPTEASITPIMHYLCDAFMRITFDNNSDPQVLNIDVIGELAGSAINAGLIQQSIAIAPIQSIGQQYTVYANITTFNGMLLGVPMNFGFIALSTIENKVYPSQCTVSGSE